MSLNIKNEEVEQLVSSLAAARGETKTNIVKAALVSESRRTTTRVNRAERIRSFLRYLEEEIWPNLPAQEVGTPLSKQERESILGYRSEGV